LGRGCRRRKHGDLLPKGEVLGDEPCPRPKAAAQRADDGNKQLKHGRHPRRFCVHRHRRIAARDAVDSLQEARAIISPAQPVVSGCQVLQTAYQRRQNARIYLEATFDTEPLGFAAEVLATP